MGYRGLFVSFKQLPESVESCVVPASGLVLCYRLHRILSQSGTAMSKRSREAELEKLKKDGIVMDTFQYE